MAPKQRMRVANEKASKNITLRGNVPKSTVSRQEKPISGLNDRKIPKNGRNSNFKVI